MYQIKNSCLLITSDGSIHIDDPSDTSTSSDNVLKITVTPSFCSWDIDEITIEYNDNKEVISGDVIFNSILDNSSTLSSKISNVCANMTLFQRKRGCKIINVSGEDDEALFHNFIYGSCLSLALYTLSQWKVWKFDDTIHLDGRITRSDVYLANSPAFISQVNDPVLRSLIEHHEDFWSVWIGFIPSSCVPIVGRDHIIEQSQQESTSELDIMLRTDDEPENDPRVTRVGLDRVPTPELHNYQGYERRDESVSEEVYHKGITRDADGIEPEDPQHFKRQAHNIDASNESQSPGRYSKTRPHNLIDNTDIERESDPNRHRVNKQDYDINPSEEEQYIKRDHRRVDSISESEEYEYIKRRQAHGIDSTQSEDHQYFKRQHHRTDDTSGSDEYEYIKRQHHRSDDTSDSDGHNNSKAKHNVRSKKNNQYITSSDDREIYSAKHHNPINPRRDDQTDRDNLDNIIDGVAPRYTQHVKHITRDNEQNDHQYKRTGNMSIITSRGRELDILLHEIPEDQEYKLRQVVDKDIITTEEDRLIFRSQDIISSVDEYLNCDETEMRPEEIRSIVREELQLINTESSKDDITIHINRVISEIEEHRSNAKVTHQDSQALIEEATEQWRREIEAKEQEILELKGIASELVEKNRSLHDKISELEGSIATEREYWSEKLSEIECNITANKNNEVQHMKEEVQRLNGSILTLFELFKKRMIE
uniref:Uncharacterized protein n=1 Tax=viral metagenome TaxID=1070528 RepID=A0A6C0BLB1_9ZZZZ